uniref:Uncharacterized protein n=1 Tax=Leersia perrieri TaxID=77586 RepID=A0A0D9XWL3_9ORYZ
MVAAAASVYRRVLKAVHNHVGRGDSKNHFREFVASEFRRPTGTDADARARLRLAGDYAYLLTSVHHHKMEQCDDLGGRYLKQVSQNFTFTVKPLTVTSFARRNLIRGVLPELHSIDGVFEPRNSSASGGALVFLGTIPGSLADVMKRKKRSCI